MRYYLLKKLYPEELRCKLKHNGTKKKRMITQEEKSAERELESIGNIDQLIDIIELQNTEETYQEIQTQHLTGGKGDNPKGKQVNFQSEK